MLLGPRDDRMVVQRAVAAVILLLNAGMPAIRAVSCGSMLTGSMNSGLQKACGFIYDSVVLDNYGTKQDTSDRHQQ